MPKNNEEKKDLAIQDVEIIKPITPLDIIAQNRDTGATIEEMEKLFELQLRFDANEAKKAYYEAMAKFKAVGVEIVKDTHVSYTTSKGTTAYDHASLGHIVDKIISSMSEFGLMHTWSMDQPDGKVRVTCKIAHALGHSETVSMEAKADDSGGKNSIQAIASSNTYLQRYTLLAATGLASKELTPDDDGEGSEVDKVEVINEQQWADLDTMLDQANADREKFCKAYQIKDIAFLPAKQFDHAMKSLNKKKENNNV